VTYVIAEPCLASKDKSCIEVCPVDCIVEITQMLVIDPVECIDCGACAEECPVEAIYLDVDVPPEWEAFTAINAAILQGREAAERAFERERG
jgi:NAD-dependent dihydropyrimidine dehydrogenase PreA subunit